MKLSIPKWATGIDDDNVAVMLWFLRRLSVFWPKGKKTYTTMSGYSFCIKHEDVELMVKDKFPILKLYKYQSIKDNLTVADVGTGYLFQYKQARNTTVYELKERRAQEIVIYLLGCLNHNLIEPEKPKGEISYVLNDKLINRRFTVGDWAKSPYEDEGEGEHTF